MSTLPQPPAGGDFTPPPAGTFPAICYRVIDLGTQQTTYNGQTKRQHKVLLSWELKDEDAVTEDGQPMTIHQRYTWSTHEKAALRQHLESWRGKAFSEADFGPGGFDIKNVLGVGCLLGIVHAEKNDRTFANISSVSKIPKGMEPPSGPVNEKLFLWLEPDKFDREVLAKLSDSLQDTIKFSPEYQELMKMNGSAQEPYEAYADADNGQHPFAPGNEPNDPIPFAPERR